MVNNYIVKSLSEKYGIRSDGSVVNLKTYKLLKPWKDKDGYLRIRMGRDGRNLYVHRLVAQTFIPNPDNLPQVNHKDGNKSNNRLDNLEWISASANTIHAYDTGLSAKGDNNSLSKLTSYEVDIIRRVYTKGCNVNGCAALGRRFAVSESAIRKVVNRVTWA